MRNIVKQTRQVLFLSDGTGITAQTVGKGLLSQFPDISFEFETCRFLNTVEKAQAVRDRIDQITEQTGAAPILFATFANEAVQGVIEQSSGVLLEFLQTHITRLEDVLQTRSSHSVGRSHALFDDAQYNARIEAVNFALATDDGTNVHRYQQADLILIGISRSGKTPTSLYLALQFGINVANYPLTVEDFEQYSLPKDLREHKAKLFGLIIDADRLMAIRAERQPDSQYASQKQCQFELNCAMQLYRQEQIAYLNSTRLSVEELATRILVQKQLKKRS